MSKTTRISVYGSLLSGLGNHRVIGRHIGENATFVGEDVIRGFNLYPVAGTSFPGIKRGHENDSVVVEVYDVTDVALSNVQALEGYNPNREHNNFYDEVDAESDEYGPTRAYLYMPDVDGLPVIEGGDWRRYRDDNQTKSKWQ